MSLLFANVNRDVPMSRYSIPSSMPVLTYKGEQEEGELEQAQTRERPAGERLSAPPPYSKVDPVEEQGSSNKAKTTLGTRKAQVVKREPPLLLEVALGYRLAQSLTQKHHHRRQIRLQRVHDAWMRLGVNTLLIASQGGPLPPHFWNPPNYGPEEMNERLCKLAL